MLTNTGTSWWGSSAEFSTTPPSVDNVERAEGAIYEDIVGQQGRGVFAGSRIKWPSRDFPQQHRNEPHNDGGESEEATADVPVYYDDVASRRERLKNAETIRGNEGGLEYLGCFRDHPGHLREFYKAQAHDSELEKEDEDAAGGQPEESQQGNSVHIFPRSLTPNVRIIPVPMFTAKKKHDYYLPTEGCAFLVPPADCIVGLELVSDDAFVGGYLVGLVGICRRVSILSSDNTFLTKILFMAHSRPLSRECVMIRTCVCLVDIGTY